MVSTRSQSVLSAGAATDTAATAGEVNSAAPTPRRSGRLARGSGGAAAAATPTAPRSARAAKTRKQLEAVKEVEERQEAEQAEHPPSQQEEQQPHASGDAQAQAEEQQGEQLSPRVRRRLRSAAEAALAGSPLVSQPDDAEDVSEGAAGAPSNGAEVEPVLKADAALVDVLAAQMFAALEEFTGQQQHDDSSTDSELDMIEEQQQRSGSAAETGRQRQQHQLQQEGQQQDADSSSSNDDSSDSEDEGEAGDSVPSHLRWQPELMLPGQAASGSGSGAAARSAAAPAGMHVVRRGKDGLHVPPPDERLRARAARTERPDTAGKGWFDLPATQITDEVKNDLRMLRLRGALDPKAHYKKLDTTKFPKYFQMGTVVESAADFYSARLTKKQRKRTLTEEVMADAQLTEVRKKRYTKLQDERSYWSKKPAKKTSNERRKKAHRRPKH